MVRATHQLVPTDTAWQCSMCLLPVRSAHRARMARTLCPTAMLTDSLGNTVDTAGPALRRASHTARVWLVRHCGRALHGVVLQPPDPPPPPQPPQPPQAALLWRPHRIVTGGRLVTCLICGRRNTAREPRFLQGAPCPGWSPNPGQLLQALHAGVFDACLATASVATREAATARGWRSIPTG